MPRTLPWLTEKAAPKAAAKKPAAKAASKLPSASPRDLVGSDLEDVEEEPANKRKKAPHREPSSSPPPVVREPPPQEMMRPGYADDDGWMMVEDEFYSTAQLFTQHLHQEAYAQLKKLHKSRGQETLAALSRGTDGKTAQSKQLQLKLLAEENAKKRKQAMTRDGGSEEEDDEYMLDPQLAGLMTGSQGQRGPDVSRLGLARSRRSMAEDGDDHSDPLPEPDLSPVAEEQEEEEEETDSDDLSRPPRKQQPVVKAPSTISRPREAKAPAPRIFQQFARTKVEEKEDVPAASSLPSSPPPRLPATTRPKPETEARPQPRSPSPQRERTFTSRTPALVKEERSSSPVNPLSRPMPAQAKTPTFLAKRRAQKIKEEADAKRKEIEDSIPTFLF